MVHHWNCRGRVTHICVGKLYHLVSVHGLSPVRHQAIIWNNNALLPIRPLGTDFSQRHFEHNSSTIRAHSRRWKIPCTKRQPFLSAAICYLNHTGTFVRTSGKPITITLTYWGRVTHICVDKTTIIGSDNGLSPGRRQAIIWTSAGILLIGPLGTNVSEILIEIHIFSFKKMQLKTSSTKWRPFRLSLNVLILNQQGLCVLGWTPNWWFVG